jgi:hypothetical protein
MEAVFALIHSPIVSSFTWSLVAEALRRRGVEVVVPPLEDSEAAGLPYWKQHAESTAHGLREIPVDQPLVLVAHSGAGPLLPSIRAAVRNPVAAYIFVDAGLPKDGESRLDLIETEAPDFAAPLKEHLGAGGRFPEWTEEALREEIPEDGLRQNVVAEQRSRSLDFFTEPIPVFAGWPDAPCGYLQFSSAYDYPAEQAQKRGWAYRQTVAGHFHMLVDPSGVANALIELVAILKTRYPVDLSGS